ncbi:hypothetical protein QBC46DRAFT_326379 [Diplogelasinospora grovesii]|uniref:LysM domain-containing protein n=1 Tax=Diplogelasinospora grovesii TaxID=303347 RepID=A0AAN6RY54_9PEZI|nr:hypothetical protein QBC46DRAFT_326379 [Diplogelasinospora grovesii]
MLFELLSLLLLCLTATASDHVIHPGRLLRRVTTLTVPDKPTQTGTISTCNEWYDVVSGDTCSGVASSFGITLAQFLQWNPAVSSDCSVNFWVGDSYCVGVSSGTPSTSKTSSSSTQSGTSSSSTQGSTTVSSRSTSPSSIPPNASSYSIIGNETSAVQTDRPTATQGAMQTGIASPCIRLVQANPGDTCQSIINAYSYLSMELFLKWNPEVGSDCSGLYVNYFYCIDAPIDVGSLPNATTQYFPALTTIASSTISLNSTFAPSPTAPGAASGCQSWYLAVTGDTCASLSQAMGYFSVSDFQTWNSGVNCNSALTAGDYYCVANYSSSNLPMPSTVTTTPTPVQTGITAACTAWYLAAFGDDCAIIPQIFGTFSQSDFLTWNPALGSNCAGLVPGDYYCVAVPGTPTTRTTGVPTTTSFPSNGVGPQPEQTGIPASCSAYWLVSPSDNCTTIAAANGVTETQIEQWNPALGGAGCPNLLADYYICVGMPGTTGSVTTTSGSTGPTGSTTTTSSSSGVAATTSPPISTPTPVQAGMVAGCSRFYLVESGDGCFAIASDAGIALNDFYTWNPAVNQCSTLLSGFFVCIGLTGAPATITSGTPFGPTPTPVQTGMVSSCSRFYLVESGDSCSMIATDAGITLTQFYSMNPAVGTSCQDLEAGVYVCIGTTGAGTTIASGTPVPAPTKRK